MEDHRTIFFCIGPGFRIEDEGTGLDQETRSGETNGIIRARLSSGPAARLRQDTKNKSSVSTDEIKQNMFPSKRIAYSDIRPERLSQVRFETGGE